MKWEKHNELNCFFIFSSYSPNKWEIRVTRTEKIPKWCKRLSKRLKPRRAKTSSCWKLVSTVHLVLMLQQSCDVVPCRKSTKKSFLVFLHNLKVKLEKERVKFLILTFAWPEEHHSTEHFEADPFLYFRFPRGLQFACMFLGQDTICQDSQLGYSKLQHYRGKQVQQSMPLDKPEANI